MMKRTGHGFTKGAALAIIMVLASFTFVTASYAFIFGSDHDFTISGAGNFSGNFLGDNDEPCVYCHTPHAANTTAQTPLWNKNLSFPNGFTPYTNSTMDSSMLGTPSTVSQLCLSCHDGVGAINSVLNSPGPGTHVLDPGAFDDQIGDLGSAAATINIGEGDPGVPGPVDLSNDHPISIVYADAGGPAGGFNATPTDPRLRLLNGMVECTTCHDPHADAPGIGEVQFLVMSNANSAMCLACHIK